jgi:hypothetical protein
MAEIPADLIRRTSETNVFSNLALTQQVIRKFVDAGTPGRVVIVSSMGGMLTACGLGVYCASKHALEAIAATLRDELAGTGITRADDQPRRLQHRLQRPSRRVHLRMARRLGELHPRGRHPGHPRRDHERPVRPPGNDRPHGRGDRRRRRQVRNVWPPETEELIKQVQATAWTRQAG